MIIVPPQRTSHTTARSRALSERLRATIAEYQVREPKVTKEEIAQALHDVSLPAERTVDKRRVTIVATVAGSMCAAGIGLLVSSSQKAGRQPSMWIALSILAVMIVAVAAVATKLRGDD